MPVRPHAFLTIDFDLSAEVLAGMVCDEWQNRHAFVGWMALTRTIEDALEAARSAEPGSGPVDVAPAPRPALPVDTHAQESSR